MKRAYLGDSYDAVKRLWQNIFREWAPLHANPRFVPSDLRSDFTKLTRIPLLEGKQRGAYSILNDPDTGIRLPDRANQAEGKTHVTLETIRSQLTEPGVRCVVTFDQSNHREAGNPAKSQRDSKRAWLKSRSVQSFYYVSHAPFLFAFADNESRKVAATLLKSAGIPRTRIEQ